MSRPAPVAPKPAPLEELAREFGGPGPVARPAVSVSVER
jgi:hypothetical protein